MTLRCRLGRHAHPQHAMVDGRLVLLCPECWGYVSYPETDVTALRAEQRRQRVAIDQQRATAHAMVREIVMR